MHGRSVRLNTFHYITLLLAIALCFFYGFASYAIENINEGLYAEVAREMFATGNYLIPHLNYVPYLEKPPLLYWLIAGLYHVFGVSAFSARLIPVLSSACVCISVMFFGMSQRKPLFGWIAAMILATSVGFILIGRVLIFDMLLTLFFSLSLIFFYLWYERQKGHQIWLAYAFMGLAFMTKGLLAVALIPSIAFLFMWINRTPWRKQFRIFNPLGMLAFLAIVVPWVILATMKQPGFAWDYFVNEQVLRFLNTRFPHDYHTGPFYFYIPRLFIYLLPWSILLPAIFTRLRFATEQTKQLLRFLWLWFLVPLVFFSLSQEKGDYYMVLGTPALALLLALRFELYFSEDKTKVLAWLFTGLVILEFISLGLLNLATYHVHFWNLIPQREALIPALKKPLMIATVVVAVYGIGGLLLTWKVKRRPILPFILIAGFIIPIVGFYVVDKRVWQENRSAVAIGGYIHKHAPHRPLYLYQNYEDFSSVLFYARKRATLIDSKSEDLYYGSKAPAAKGWFISTAEFANRVKNNDVFVVLYHWKIRSFERKVGVNFCQVAESGRVVLLTNDCQPGSQRDT